MTELGHVGFDDRFRRLAGSPQSCHSDASRKPGGTSPISDAPSALDRASGWRKYAACS